MANPISRRKTRGKARISMHSPAWEEKPCRYVLRVLVLIELLYAFASDHIKTATIENVLCDSIRIASLSDSRIHASPQSLINHLADDFVGKVFPHLGETRLSGNYTRFEKMGGVNREGNTEDLFLGMSLIQQHTIDDSTILVSHSNRFHSPEFPVKMADFLQQRQFASGQDQIPSSKPVQCHPQRLRLDSAICMPSAKKSTAYCESTTKAKEDCRENESLERWVDNLLKEFDNVMSVNLNTDLSQENNRRVKELIQQIDDRLNNTLTDNIESFREFVREKKIDCELLLKNNTLIKQGDAREDGTLLVGQGVNKAKVPDTASKEVPNKKFARFLKKAASPITKNLHRITEREKNSDSTPE
ncbi:7447_t:CDS:2, partial [Acaulospora morrowiae]